MSNIKYTVVVICLWPEFFKKGATAATGRQGVLKGGGEGGGYIPSSKILPPIFFQQIFPEAAMAAAGRQGVLEGGNEVEVSAPHKRRGAKRHTMEFTIRMYPSQSNIRIIIVAWQKHYSQSVQKPV